MEGRTTARLTSCGVPVKGGFANGSTNVPKYVNKFKSPVFREETIVNPSGKKVGDIRIKPSGILWKPKGQQRYYSVGLDDFIDWITTRQEGVERTKS